MTASCTGNCGQGRRQCPCPDSCELPELSPFESWAIIAVYASSGILAITCLVLLWSYFS
jgi:hypothetical protein